MATSYFINPDRTVNGTGSEGDPFNTFVGIPGGAYHYRIARGTTVRESWVMGAGTSGATVYDYGDGALPIFDCEGVRNTGILCDARSAVELFNLEFRNQNAAAPAAGLQISGSTGGRCYVHDCVFRSNRIGIHINNSPANRIIQNTFYCGHPDYLTYSYGVRVNGASSIANSISLNRAYGSAIHDHVASIQAYGAPNTAIIANEVDGAMSDAISVFIGADGSSVIGNLVYGSLLKDAIAIEDSDAPMVCNNTVWHPGDLANHSGPCLKIGDNFGSGTAPINAVVRNNLLVAVNRLPMALDPLGSGAVFSNNLYWKLRGDGGAIVNYDDGGGIVSLNFANWLLEGLDSNSLNQDPLLDASYRPMAGSPCVGAAVYIKGAKHMGGLRLRSPADIGAYRYAPELQTIATRSTVASRQTTTSRSSNLLRPHR